MDKIKRFIDCYIPVTTCTLRCHYCYITCHRLFEGRLPKFRYSPEQVRKALSKERLGGTCLINMCAGGETLLAQEVVDYARVLLEEGHYVMIVTNATVSKRFDEIAQFPSELTKRLFFKFSYHYLELKEKNLLDVFFSNIKKVRDVGCSFTLELTPSDEAIPYIEDIKKVAVENLGAIPHVTIARDEHNPAYLPILTKLSHQDYEKIWGTFNSVMFNYKVSIFEKKRTEFCYAGDWSFYLNMLTGEMTQCYCSYIRQNIFEEPSKPINFLAIGHNCSEHHCYNGHAFLTLGNIPELLSPTYAAIRNRITKDGSEWLKPEMKAFMSTKLNESNDEYTDEQKCAVDKKIAQIKRNRIIKNRIKTVIRKLKP